MLFFLFCVTDQINNSDYLLHQQTKVQEFLMVRATICSLNKVPVRIIYEDMYLLSVECWLVYMR